MVTIKVLVFLFGIISAYGASVYESRIIGGSTAPDGSFPYQVSMRYGDEHICGGSIVNPTTILTAGHCLLGDLEVEYITVVVGTHTLNAGGVTHTISKAISHPSFNKTTGHHDIAILKVSKPISFNNLVFPIKLAYPQELPETATLSGWGLTRFPSDQLPNDLRYINLKVIDRRTCADLNPTSRTLTPGNICTISPAGQGSCQYDSGGPLVANDEQIGVVSWGVPCALGHPDVFTSVAAYREFISQHEGPF